MATVDLPLSKLRRRLDARKLVPRTVASIAESMREVGIISPLRVRPKVLIEGGREAEGWEITCGGHRFEAASRCGFEKVPCVVVDEDDDHAELAMIDENLRRTQDSDAERASLTRRRKDVYERLYPETAHGGDRRSIKSQNVQLENSPARFTAETAAVSGKSERVVQLDAERGKKISERAMALIHRSPLDNGSYLDKIKRVPTEDQVAMVERDLANPPKPAPRKPVSPAPEPRNSFESEQAWLARLTKVFEAGAEDWRARAKDHLFPDSAPIMDRRHG